MTTVPNTPRDILSAPAVVDELDGALQCLHSNSLAALDPQRQTSGDESNSSRRLPSIPSTEAAEQDHGLAEDANEPLLSQCDHNTPGGHSQPPQQPLPHESVSQHRVASHTADGNITDDGDSDSCGDSSDDSDGANDGDDDDYDDDRGSSDTDDKDGGYSKKRAIDSSPSTSHSDSGHVDGPAEGNAKEIPARSHKRQKVTHDRASTLHRLDATRRSAGRLSRSPERSQAATMPSPPASNGLSETESDKGSDCSKASTASFGEWLLQNATLKCVTVDGVNTYQLQFQGAPMHSCSRRRERRAHTLAKTSKIYRKPRNETRGRRCGLCKQVGHNARTCRGDAETACT